MTAFPRAALAAPVAALLAVTSPAQAGEHRLTENEVRAYFDQIEQEATEMARSDELGRIVEWIEHNIAAGAQFRSA